MSRPRVYIARPIPHEVEKYIGQFCDYEKWESDRDITRTELMDKLTDKDGVILAGIKIDEELLEHAPRLKVVSNIAVGYNNFDIEAMKSRGVIGTNTPHVLDDTVADLVMALILSAARRTAELDRYVRNGMWKAGNDEVLYGMDVHHSTLGIIGMGRIGGAVAKRAKLGFDMDVLYFNRNRRPEVEDKLGVKYRNLQALLMESDFIVLMTPLTSDTYHLIDYKEFAMMKKTAIFINASRGQTVNEDALIDALESEKILGAGLDVFETEPVKIDNPLLKIPNAVILPHVGSATAKTRYEMARLAAENLVRALSGEVPPCIVPELR